MKTTFSGFGITAANGSYGNNTITRNRYGAYQKQKNPAPVITPQMTTWAALFGLAHTAWEVMTDPERHEWIEAAINTNRKQQLKQRGNVERNVQLTGFHYFMRYAMNVIIAGAGFGPTPPQLVPILAPLRITVPTATAASIILNYSPALTGNWQMVIYVSALLPPGRMSMNQIYFLIGSISNASGVDIFPNYSARFGAPPVAGKKLFFRIDFINSITGQRSPSVYTSAIVT